MLVKELSAMTWEEVRDLERSRTVMILPIGAIEAHGPHLPLRTDVIIAEAMAQSGGERLAKAGLSAVVLPALAYAPAPFAAAFPGTIGVRPETLTSLVVDIARALAEHSFRYLAIANAHLDPTHLAALDAAVRTLGEDERISVTFPNIVRRTFAGRLTEEFRHGACHAGRYESSMVIAEQPDLVREEIRSALEPVPHSLSEAIGAGKRSFGEIGGDRAYFGWPADATAEEGRSSIAALGEILAETVLAAVRGGEAQ